VCSRFSLDAHVDSLWTGFRDSNGRVPIRRLSVAGWLHDVCAYPKLASSVHKNTVFGGRERPSRRRRSNELIHDGSLCEDRDSERNTGGTKTLTEKSEPQAIGCKGLHKPDAVYWDTTSILQRVTVTITTSKPLPESTRSGRWKTPLVAQIHTIRRRIDL